LKVFKTTLKSWKGSLPPRGTLAFHHRFVSGEGELVVIDEWETAEQFQSFFDGNPDVAQVMTSIGMTGAPEISVYGSIDAPGNV
jgi:hypothetical protein